MILLISSMANAFHYKQVLQSAIGETVELAMSLREASLSVRRNQYSVLVIDQDLAMAEADAEISVLRNCGAAFPLYSKLTICSPERLLREVQSALRRRDAERIAALRIASSDLKKELAGAVTGILLSSELAMSVPELPRAAQVKIKFVHDLAKGMRQQLEAC